tara:strand:+ start:2192 stop:2740 length:549 start_codon:yes stop_codon:yes gene_type:complete
MSIKKVKTKEELTPYTYQNIADDWQGNSIETKGLKVEYKEGKEIMTTTHYLGEIRPFYLLPDYELQMQLDSLEKESLRYRKTKEGSIVSIILSIQGINDEIRMRAHKDYETYHKQWLITGLERWKNSKEIELATNKIHWAKKRVEKEQLELEKCEKELEGFKEHLVQIEEQLKKYENKPIKT